MSSKKIGSPGLTANRKYDLRSHTTTLMLWRGCVAALLSGHLILWTTFFSFKVVTE